MTTTITIGQTPINTTYSLVGGTTNGAGAQAKFTVQKTNGVYVTTLDSTNGEHGRGEEREQHGWLSPTHCVRRITP